MRLWEVLAKIFAHLLGRVSEQQLNVLELVCRDLTLELLHALLQLHQEIVKLANALLV